MDRLSLLADIKNRLRDQVAEFEGRAAGFPFIPTVTAVKSRFSKYPYAFVVPTTVRLLERDPPALWVAANNRIIERSYDIAVVFNPGEEGTDPDGLLLEALPERLMETFINWRVSSNDICWICDVGNWEEQVSTDAFTIFAVPLYFRAKVVMPSAPADQIQSALDDAGHFKIQGKGSLA